MPGGINSSAQWPEFMEKVEGLSKDILAKRLKEPQHEQYMYMAPASKKAVDRMQTIEAMGTTPRWLENTTPEHVNIEPGYAHRMGKVEFGSRISQTLRMKEYDQFGVYAEAARQQVESVDPTLQTLLVNYLAQGETAQSSIFAPLGDPIVFTDGPDGLPFFSASHRFRTNATAWSNYDSVGGTPSESLLATKATVIRRWKDNQGLPSRVKATKVVAPPELEQVLLQTIRSDKNPLNANNTYNTATYFLPGGYVINDYLANTSDWYILTDYEKGRPWFRWGWKPRVVRRPAMVDDALNESQYLNMSFGHAAPPLPRGVYKMG